MVSWCPTMRYYIVTMNSNSSPNVIFALILGSALVLGVIVLNSVTDRISGIGSIEPETTTRSLPDLNASALRESIDDESWEQTLNLRNTPTVTIRDDATASESYTRPDTTTARLSISLLETMVQNAAGELDEEARAAALESIANQSTDETLPEFYKPRDITVLRRYDENDIRTYFNALGDAFVTHSPRSDVPTLELYDGIIQNNDETSRSLLTQRKVAYETMRDEIANLSVPRSQLAHHLAFLNAIHLLQHDFGNILAYHDDIVLGYFASLRHNENTWGLTKAMQNIGVDVIRHADLFGDFAEDSALLFALTLPTEEDLNTNL